MTKIRPMFVKERSYWPHIAAIALLWAAVMSMEYADARSAADEAEAQFVACLRGEWKTTTEEGHEIGCPPVEVLRKEEQSGTKN